MTWPVEYRQKIVDYVKAGHTKAQAAGVFLVNAHTITDWTKREVLEAAPNWRKGKSKYDIPAFEAYVKAHPEVKSRVLEKKFKMSRCVVLRLCQQFGVPRMDCRIRINLDEFRAFLSTTPPPSNKAIMKRFRVSQSTVSRYRGLASIKVDCRKMTLKQFARFMAKRPRATLNETMAHFQVSMPTVSRYRRLLKNIRN